MKNPSRSLFVILPLLATAAFALPPPPETIREGEPVPGENASRGETSLTLDVGFGIRYVPPSRVTVPVGETLRVTAPDMGNVNYIWTKNGQALPGASSRVLLLNSVAASDAGVYACLFSTATTLPQPSQTLILGVGPTDRLMNLSTRGTVGANPEEGLVSGFVVQASGRGKKLIIRAIGPSLATFGVANSLRKPVLRVLDASGRPYENGFVYPAVIGGPTYESDLAESLVRAGAFAVPKDAGDAVTMQPFVPGSYTVEVISGDGTAGTVLLEIYEVP